VLCRMGGVGTWGSVSFFYSRLIYLVLWYHLMFVEIICTCTPEDGQ